MTGARGGGPRRVRVSYVEQLMDRLSARDWAILGTLHRVRLATSLQLERLHFSDLTTPASRNRVRRRVLKRLAEARVLATLEQQIGTAQQGSERLSYLLDSAGRRLLQLRADREGLDVRIRRLWEPGEQFAHHILTVTELYVSPVERAQPGAFAVGAFQVEGDAYWPNGLGVQLKPDAFVRLLRGGDAADYWWYEAELAIKSQPAIRAKLKVYLDFVHRGQLGPDDIVPRVLVGVPTEKRREVVQAVVDALPEPADVLFRVALLPEVPQIMIDELMKP